MLRWPNSKHAGRTTDFAYVMDAVAACRRPFFPMSCGGAFLLWQWRRPAAADIQIQFFDVLSLNLYGRHNRK